MVQEGGSVRDKVPEQEPYVPKPMPEGPRYTGHCKWFNVLKGYGFLLVDTTEEEVFVHQSELQMKGFRSLENNSRVSFSLRSGKKGMEAFHVMGEHEGDEIVGSSVRPIGRKKDNLIRCFKCGSYGNHVASKCRKVTTDAKVCYECKSTEHLVGHCPFRAEQRKDRKDAQQEQRKERQGSSAPSSPE